MATRNRIAIFLLTLIPGPLLAGAFDDWRLEQQGFKAQFQEEFKAYRSEQDRQFSDFLKAEWQEFSAFKGKVRDAKPKFSQAPQAPVTKGSDNVEPKSKIAELSANPSSIGPLTSYSPVVEGNEQDTNGLSKAEIRPRIGTNKSESASEVLDFYGNSIQFPEDETWKSVQFSTLKPAGFSAFWDSMSASRFQPALDAISRARKDLQLDDWGHVELWHSAVRTLRPDDQRVQTLMLWFFLVKSGIDARLAYTNDQLYVMLAAKQAIYGTTYVKVDGRPYYVLINLQPGKLKSSFYTYANDYPTPLQALDVAKAATSFTHPEKLERTVSFKHRGRNIEVKLAYDSQLVKYFNSFPQFDFELYFASKTSALARDSMLASLRPYLNGLNQEEAVGFLLAFVQKAFSYKTDDEQFGREKYFFVEDMLHYPHSDCEDRSALLSWLVHELTGLKTVGLHYPGHVTTAVALTNVRPDWTTIDWQGTRFVITDPTYINAGVGKAMPSYANEQPIRVISNF